jgi:hypothetical protein
MTFIEIALAIIAAVLVGLLFYYVFKVSGPWGSLWTFLLILILVGLAAELWIPPMGPVFYDFAWIPTLFVIILFALILAAASPSARRDIDVTSSAETDTESNMAETAGVALGIFFWFLLLFLFIAIFWGIFT